MGATSSGSDVTYASKIEQDGRPTLWVDQDDPSDTGVPIDESYCRVDTQNQSVTEAYNPEALSTDGGNVDRGSYKASTGNSDASELDANPMETAWAMQGVQRTTLYADDKDAYGNPLPQTALDGTDLGARRKRLWALNSGFYFSDRSDVGRVDREARETREMTEAVASQCGLTGRQKEQAAQTALDMDGRRFNWAGGRPAMALCAVAQTVADSVSEAKADGRLLGDGTAFEHVADKSCTVDAERLVEFAFVAKR